MDNPYLTPATTLEPPVAQPAFRLPASFGQRLLAKLIDLVIVAALAAGAAFMISLCWKGSLEVSGGELPEFAASKEAAAFLIAWLYSAWMESSQWQATLGKMALQLQVTDTRERRISFFRASGRFFGQALSFFFGWLGFVMMIATREKQTLHDMMAGCYVNDARR